MTLRDVLRRWHERPVGATLDDKGVAATCDVAPSLLEELAADPEDFVDLAAVLRLDVCALSVALVRERLRTPAELAERLTSGVAGLRSHAGTAGGRQQQSSWGGRGAMAPS